jgi:hypothetical protein
VHRPERVEGVGGPESASASSSNAAPTASAGGASFGGAGLGGARRFMMGAVAVPPSTLGQAGSTLLSDMLRGPESGRATRFEAGEIAGTAAAANPGNLEHVRQGLLTMHTIMSVMDEPARVEERREEEQQQQEEEEEKEDGEEKESKTEEERQSAEVGHLYILVLPFKIKYDNRNISASNYSSVRRIRGTL